ncbi:MAG TPA: CopG family transcriptional regulator [Chloroflexota bacterium]|nr:CopG family transcriptional regulator [Chloroflexota bacterium]
MSLSMIRKQVYLERAQNRKLKSLAARRGCTESELIREAIDQLPDPEGDVVQQLAAAGLLAAKPKQPDEAAELEAWFEEWIQSHAEGLRFSDAVQEDREGR